MVLYVARYVCLAPFHFHKEKHNNDYGMIKNWYE